jgi:hypothetical protein
MQSQDDGWNRKLEKCPCIRARRSEKKRSCSNIKTRGKRQPTLLPLDNNVIHLYLVHRDAFPPKSSSTENIIPNDNLYSKLLLPFFQIAHGNSIKKSHFLRSTIFT